MDRVLDAAARAARVAGDPRTLDQLRADGLCDLVLHTACPAEVAGGAGSAGADLSGRPAVGLTALGLPVPGADVPGVDVPGVDAAGVDVPGVDVADGSGAGVGLHAATGAGADAGASSGRRGCRLVRPVAQVRVTVPLSTLLGGSEPGELAGYGPIDPVTARALAAGGVWRRLVTDPLSGAVLDLGRARYRPSRELAEHVMARDRTCVRPGCSADAGSCDLDHTREFHPRPGDPGPGGTTSEANLAPLCRRDHRLKTDGGHHLRQISSGRFEWVTPTGETYAMQPGVVPSPPSPPSREPAPEGGALVPLVPPDGGRWFGSEPPPDGGRWSGSEPSPDGEPPPF